MTSFWGGEKRRAKGVILWGVGKGKKITGLKKNIIYALEKIILTQFKNYAKEELAFIPSFNVLTGKNGMGKTNVLDAIYYLCMGKSYFNTSDKNMIQHGGDFFRLEGHFKLGDKAEMIVAKIKSGSKKELERNGRIYEKLAQHVGLLSVVFITPDDNSLINDGSVERRKLLDNTLSQLNPTYLQHLLTYNKLLKQRNAALKKFAEAKKTDHALLDIYDQQMAFPAQEIFLQRKKITETLVPFFQQQYGDISSRAEAVGLTYKSKLADTSFSNLIADARQKDIILQRTTVGPHKDDLTFTLKGFPIKQLASQGQLKTYVIAIKLAQFQVLKSIKKYPPILLLDDIFDKLDNQRVTSLIQMLTKSDFGQIFITDTEPNRIKKIIDQQKIKAIEYIIKNGAIIE